jgi:hypothetical protein
MWTHALRLSTFSASARVQQGPRLDQIIEELVNDKRIDPRLIRALDRI